MANWPTERVEMTYEERATFGECPVCKAPHGEWCHPEVGIQLGHRVGGGPSRQGEGAHLGRLQAAPMVRVVSYAGR